MKINILCNYINKLPIIRLSYAKEKLRFYKERVKSYKLIKFLINFLFSIPCQKRFPVLVIIIRLSAKFSFYVSIRK